MNELKLIKTLGYFFDNPYEEIHLREIARKLKLSPFAAKKYLDLLQKKSLILDERKANLRYFKANTINLIFKHLKITYSISKIVECELLSYLIENTKSLISITLFGSVVKGEDDKNSDIDIVIIGNNKISNLSKFEEKLGKNVNIHFFNWTEWKKQHKVNKAFYYDVISYGVPLYGVLPIVA